MNNLDNDTTDVWVQQLTLEHCEMLVSQFDNDLDGRLSFDEFLIMVLPASNRDLCQEALARKDISLKIGQKLPFEVEFSFYKLLLREIQLVSHLENIRRDLSATGLDITLLFKLARCSDENYISIDKHLLRQFLGSAERGVYESTLNLIMNKLDRDKDGVLNHKDFIMAVVPFLPVRAPDESPVYGEIGQKLAVNNMKRIGAKGLRFDESPPRFQTPAQNPVGRSFTLNGYMTEGMKSLRKKSLKRVSTTDPKQDGHFAHRSQPYENLRLESAASASRPPTVQSHKMITPFRPKRAMVDVTPLFENSVHSTEARTHATITVSPRRARAGVFQDSAETVDRTHTEFDLVEVGHDHSLQAKRADSLGITPLRQNTSSKQLRGVNS